MVKNKRHVVDTTWTHCIPASVDSPDTLWTQHGHNVSSGETVACHVVDTLWTHRVTHSDAWGARCGHNMDTPCHESRAQNVTRCSHVVDTLWTHRTGKQHRSTEEGYVSTRNHAQQINRQNVFLNPYSPAGGKKEKHDSPATPIRMRKTVLIVLITFQATQTRVDHRVDPC